MTADDDRMLEELGRALAHDPQRMPPPDRVAAVRAAAGRMQHQEDPEAEGASDNVTSIGRRPGRRFLLAGGIAAGVGGIAGYLGRDLVADDAGPSQAGPPVEDITFSTRAGVSVEAAGLIDHTWGTELMLDVAGLEAGRTYDVVYRTRQGADVAAGSMLAVADVVMRCRFNAATLRADVRRIEVRQGRRVALKATLPTRGA